MRWHFKRHQLPIRVHTGLFNAAKTGLQTEHTKWIGKQVSRRGRGVMGQAKCISTQCGKRHSLKQAHQDRLSGLLHRPNTKDPHHTETNDKRWPLGQVGCLQRTGRLIAKANIKRPP